MPFPSPGDLPHPGMEVTTPLLESDSLPLSHQGRPNLSVKAKVAQLCPTLCNPMDYTVWNSPAQHVGAGSLSLLQGIFSTQELNQGLPPCRQILYQLSHKPSPRILEWVFYPFSSGSSQPRNQTRVSCIAGRFFTN